MDPQALIDPAVSTPLPAPYWFIVFFKVLGFSLHVLPMNLWYVGTLLAVALHLRGGEHGRRFGRRLMAQMPILIAFGINFGIVPLLFVQLAYFKAFYPATILMAWFWLAIVGMLIPAYYGVYAYVFGMKEGDQAMPAWKRAAGWIAAVLFIAIGFTFANGLSLMTNVQDWPRLLERHSVAGAPTGTGLNLADPTLWPRWLLMLGLALGTTAAWTVVDAAWLARRESEAYRRWATGWAWRLATAGVVLFALAGSWYAFGTWGQTVRDLMFGSPLGIVMSVATAASPGALWLLLFLHRGKELSRSAATLAALAQLGAVALNAISRQVVQNVELLAYLDPSTAPVRPHWGPMALFLGSFVVGVGVLAWMIAQVIGAKPTEVV